MSTEDSGIEALKAAMKSRHDGYWEFLATAAGDPTSLQKTISGLKGSEFEAGTKGLAIAGSIVCGRVEALAAGSLSNLVALAKSWSPAKLVPDDLWYASAWYTALRHVHSSLGLTTKDFSFETTLDDWNMPTLSSEAKIVFGSGSYPKLTWDAALKEAEKHKWLYPYIRPLSFFLLPNKIKLSDIQPHSLVVLRLCRGQFHLLDNEARGYLEDMVSKPDQIRPVDRALLFEALIALESPRISEARSFITDLLKKETENPQELATTCYVLLNNWVLP